jgi:RHS repeat-associated protein
LFGKPFEYVGRVDANVREKVINGLASSYCCDLDKACPACCALGCCATLPTRYRFTGQREEAILGLYDYGARFYDPRLGRFISPDSMVPEKGNPQGLDRYAYVANSPVKHEDTSGHCWGVASGIRGLPTYGSTCNNLDMALAIVQSDQASPGERVGAGAYLAAEGLAHFALVTGTTLAACSEVAPCAEAASSLLGISAGASAIQNGLQTIQSNIQNLWNMNPSTRGNLIENLLGRSPNLAQNFPVIDRFKNGLATSIKSLDLGAKSYQNLTTLPQTVEGYGIN